MPTPNMKLGKYSIDTGNRFAHQAKAQSVVSLTAICNGVEIIPVWNKSNQEHTIIGSEPPSARAAADAAVRELDWKLPSFVDPDHIGVQTVDLVTIFERRWGRPE